MAALVVGWKISRLHATTQIEQDDTRKIYNVKGQMFFGTSSHFIELFDVANDPPNVIIDLSGSHVWDHLAVTAISKVLVKYQEAHKEVTLVGINEESEGVYSPTRQG